MPYKDPDAQRAYSREYAKRWRAKNPERAHARDKRFKDRHRERLNQKGKDWYRNNIERERSKDRAQSRARLGVIPTRPEPTHCEICGKLPQKALCLDHCHLTDSFRGWICHSCNLMLGYARDNPITLRNAAEYLLR